MVATWAGNDRAIKQSLFSLYRQRVLVTIVAFDRDLVNAGRHCAVVTHQL